MRHTLTCSMEYLGETPFPPPPAAVLVHAQGSCPWGGGRTPTRAPRLSPCSWGTRRTSTWSILFLREYFASFFFESRFPMRWADPATSVRPSLPPHPHTHFLLSATHFPHNNTHCRPHPLTPPRPDCSRVTKGLDILHKLESLPTKREGIFVMPLERVTITRSYWYRAHGPLHLSVEGPAGEEAGGGTWPAAPECGGASRCEIREGMGHHAWDVWESRQAREGGGTMGWRCCGVGRGTPSTEVAIIPHSTALFPHLGLPIHRSPPQAAAGSVRMT